ncbi:hypothetical protein QJS10_CPA02g00132 [Acorus calamus]|uniref:Thioesterase domain-containing protein n=1 Tax=Acorus calamus TaxID=4465 RepID=A0AAV9FAM9_ACOCL|nr:hypothetical protein QJS10_CPA02g00132 [Acorus calamus]
MAGPLSANPEADILDAPPQMLGFQFDVVSPEFVSGRMRVTESCCQPFKVLHGGVSALIAESLASVGAYVACGFRRVAGIQLTINHLKAAVFGDEVIAEARPITAGKTIQVWEVQLWRVDPVSSKKGSLLASSRVSFVSNMPVPEHCKDAGESIRRHAKL